MQHYRHAAPRQLFALVWMSLTVSLATTVVSAQDAATDLAVGSMAPEFEVLDDSGQPWRSSDYVGRKIVVVYFYPADMTGGCTKQACGFRDRSADLSRRDVLVVGVSGDSVRNHTLFKSVHSLNFPLLADENGDVARAFGVPIKDGGSITRTIDGREHILTRGVTIARWTFVIDYDGRIAYKNAKVDAANDSAAVTAAIDALRTRGASHFRSDGGVAVDDGHPLPATFSQENTVWRTKLASGHSTPCIYGSHIFLTTYSRPELATVALDRRSGEIRWKRVVPNVRLEGVHRTGNPASCTVACDGERVFAFFGSYGVLCYSLDGQLIWSRPMGPFQDEFGANSSPVLAGDKVIVNQDHDIGSFLMALNKETGETAWKTPREGFTRSYATPLVWDSGEGTQLIVGGALQLTSYDLETGRPLWWCDGMARIYSTTPTLVDGVIYSASWTPGGDPTGRISMEPWSEAAKQWDADKSGKIARAELSPGPVLQRFYRMDLDQDGALDESEWKKYAQVFERAQNAVLAIRADASARGNITDSHVLWKYERNVPFVPSPLFYRGVLYAVKDSAIVTSFDAGSGDVLKQGRAKGLGNYYASPVAGDGKVYVSSMNGVITVLKAAPQWEILGSHDFGATIMATPAIHEGRIYVRTENELACFAAQATSG